MKAPTSMILALTILVVMPVWIQCSQAITLAIKLEKPEEIGPMSTGSITGEYHFTNGDNPSDITDDSSLDLEECHEHPEKPTPIIFRDTSDTDVQLQLLETPPEFVIIKDGGQHCETEVDCLYQIHKMRMKARKKECEFLENFYVGGDGKVYEGRGWENASYWYLSGLRKKSITVQFLGLHDRKLPSPEAIEAFEATMEIGLWLGKLSKTFRISSFRQIHWDQTVSEDVLSQNPTESDRWVKGEDLSDVWEYTVTGRLRFVFKRHWKALRPTRELASVSGPVDHVALSEGGDRCYNRSDCISQMQAIQAENIDYYGDLLDNFYIGDGGEVYEGRGWDSAPLWYSKRHENKYISVRLLGAYMDDQPSHKAINSLKLLIQTGVWLGKISPGYRMFSLRQIYNQSSLMGNGFQKIADKWSQWSGESFIKSTANSFVLKPFLRRSEWNGTTAHSDSIILTRSPQIKYVMIGDGGSRCFSVAQCSARMVLEQKQSMVKYGELLDNFFIGDDGVVYEGLGWDSLPFFHTPFFNDSLIAVKFFGSFQSSLPSKPAWLAFIALLDAGVDSGKIFPDYKLYSFRHIYNDSTLLGNEMTKLFEAMKSWDRKLSQKSEDDSVSSGILPMHVLDLPGMNKTHTEYLPIKPPVKYVVVGHSGESCFTPEICRSSMNERIKLEARAYNNFLYNFYVGEDGRIYVGGGWTSTSFWHVRGVKADTVFVTFMGNFQNAVPSAYAFMAFHRLLQFGISTGKLSVDHKIISLHQFYLNSTHADDKLTEKIKSLDRWSEYQALSPVGLSIPFGPSAFVARSKWSALNLPQIESQGLGLPVSHLIILKANINCSKLEECILRVQAEEKHTHNESGVEMENFYIGEDGRIYEGRGWSQKTHWHEKIQNLNFITVAFLGKFRTELPSASALTAFDFFYKEGIIKRKLSNNFTIFSLGQFIESDEIHGGAFDNYIRTWDYWSNNTSEAYVQGNFEISSTSVWGRSKSIRRSNLLFRPLKYIFVREGGQPCSSQSECIRRMKTIENEGDGITENFYIGGTGEVFEGIGWLYDTKWGYDGWRYSISVQFLGTFDTSVPTTYAQDAFTSLCKHGEEEGHISHNYKILFIPDKYNSRRWVGSRFKELIKTWRHWAPNI